MGNKTPSGDQCPSAVGDSSYDYTTNQRKENASSGQETTTNQRTRNNPPCQEIRVTTNKPSPVCFKNTFTHSHLRDGIDPDSQTSEASYFPTNDQFELYAKETMYDLPKETFTEAHVRTMVRALYKFKGIDESELTFNKDDLLEIGGVLPESMEWVVAVHMKTKKCGYIPSNYVTKSDKSPQSQDWWFEYDKKEANKKLMHPGISQGTFLVRHATDKTSLVLSIRDTERASGDPSVQHYRIHQMDDQQGFYISAKKIFPSFLELINNYKERSSGLCCRLTAPYTHVAPVVPFRELEMSRRDVCLSTKLGAGSFGEVWKGLYLKAVDVAVKTLKSGIISSETFLSEARVMHQLRHPKLVQILGVCADQEPFYVVTELMVNGALIDFLHSSKGRRLKFDTLIGMNAQIAEGMAYLESIDFVHRDLRAANILMGRNLDLKVADFGLARIHQDQAQDAASEPTIPTKWTAPEAVWQGRFSVKSDVWSYGVLMSEIITFGKPPYTGMSDHEVLTKLGNGFKMDKPQNGVFEVPDSYYDMMVKCWRTSPEERPTFYSLYDFFSDYFVNTEPAYRELTD